MKGATLRLKIHLLRHQPGSCPSGQQKCLAALKALFALLGIKKERQGETPPLFEVEVAQSAGGEHYLRQPSACRRAA